MQLIFPVDAINKVEYEIQYLPSHFHSVLTSSSQFTLECQFPTSGMRTSGSSRTHTFALNEKKNENESENETILSQFLSLSERNAYKVKHCRCSKRQTSHKFHLATKHSYTHSRNFCQAPFSQTPQPLFHSFRFFRRSVKTNKCFHCVESLLVCSGVCVFAFAFDSHLHFIWYVYSGKIIMK